MSCSNGQVANQTTFNNAFVSRTVDTSTVGKLDLLNGAAVSGPTIANIQRELNALASFLGAATGAVYNVTPVWTNADVGSPTDDVKDRADSLTAEFNPTSGHDHDGVNSKAVAAASITGVRLRGSLVRGVNQSAVTGSTKIVTTDMTGKTASSGTTVKGVVVTAPDNKVAMRERATAGFSDLITDTLGNEVFGRITESAGVWTLSFFVLIGVTETAFALSAQDFSWYYQELYNPITDAPVYSEILSVPSDNATQDVENATAALAGKVTLQGTASADIAAAGTSGTATGEVANRDHTHKGVASLAKTAGTALFGAVTLTEGAGISITQVGNALTLAATSSGGGGSLQWVEGPSAAPLPETTAQGDQVYQYLAGGGQDLFALVRVPNGYTAGSQIRMRALAYAPGVAGNLLMLTQATLIRTGTDPVTSTTNQRTSTNTAFTVPGTANVPTAIVFDLSSATGQINAVAVAAGDLIRVRLYRDTDTLADDAALPVYGFEVSFT